MTLGRAAIAVTSLVLAALAGSTRPAPAAELPGVFKGNAYGAISNGITGTLAKQLHKVAYRPLPCGGTKGSELVKSVNGLAAGDVLAADSVTSSIQTSKTDVSARMVSRSVLTGVSFLGGRVTASSITAVSTTDADAGLVRTSPAGSEIVGLKIDGNPIADPAPGTSWVLDGIGTLTARKLDVSGSGRNTQRLIVDMLQLKLAAGNTLGLPSGSAVIVGHAQSSFTRSLGTFSVGGQTWVGFQTGGLLEQQGFQAISCDGTGGKVVVHDVANVRLPGIEMDSATTTKQANMDASSAFVRTSTTARAGRVLGGLITFDSIVAVADDRYNGSTHVRSTAGTAFSGLVINGLSYDNPAPNGLRIPLAGYGTLYVNEQIVPGPGSRNKMRVNGLRLLIDTAPNSLGLPVGGELFVAHADAVTQR